MPDQGSEKPGGSGLDRDPLAAELGRTAEYEPGSEPTEHRAGTPGGGPGQLEPGSTIGGRFIIRRLVARGGMGEVYEAEDTALKTRVALKTLLPGLAEHPESLDRFRREVLLARSVAHPNVCKVFELHSVQIAGDPLHFLTMEFLEGEPLSALMRKRGPLSTSEALPLVRQMAAALDAAHEHGVVHRDFKPSNVILVQQRGRDGSEGVRVVVTDFGIARALSTSRQDLEATGGTRTNEFLGTPDYIAPEQVSDKDAISGATDLFALGVVVYQMVTGALPFQGDTRSRSSQAGCGILPARRSP